jgi:hypothetical protein
MLNTTPDALAFRKATNARPRRPVPRSKRLLGSGVGVEVEPAVISREYPYWVSLEVRVNEAGVGS